MLQNFHNHTFVFPAHVYPFRRLTPAIFCRKPFGGTFAAKPSQTCANRSASSFAHGSHLTTTMWGTDARSHPNSKLAAAALWGAGADVQMHAHITSQQQECAGDRHRDVYRFAPTLPFTSADSADAERCPAACREATCGSRRAAPRGTGAAWPAHRRAGR